MAQISKDLEIGKHTESQIPLRISLCTGMCIFNMYLDIFERKISVQLCICVHNLLPPSETSLQQCVPSSQTLFYIFNLHSQVALKKIFSLPSFRENTSKLTPSSLSILISFIHSHLLYPSSLSLQMGFRKNHHNTIK